MPWPATSACGSAAACSSPRALAGTCRCSSGLLLLSLALGDWLEIPQQLFEPSGIITGPSYTDVHARIPALRVLAGVGVLGALLAVVQAFSVRLWPIAIAIGGYVLVSLGGTVYATTVQRFYVAPNEQVRETPFIQYNISATRAAFGLDAVEERQLSGDATLTRADLDRNADTIDNVPLWDHQPLLDTFSQIQEIRTYYDFVSVDNDRYTINGRYRQIMLSARELNSESLPNRTWINEQLTFTHGYGLTLGPVNEVTPEGLPDPVHQEPAARIDRRPQGHRAVDLLRRALQRPRVRQDEHEGVPLPVGRRQRLCRVPGAAAACRSGRSGASCCSPSASGRARRCCPTTCGPTAG